MPAPIVVHVAAMRRQVRRLHRVALGATVVLIATVVVLGATVGVSWLSLALLAGAAGYLHRTARLAWRTRQAIKQLRLEEQFLHHGPSPAEVRSCLWCRDHLWARSLTMRGLKTLSQAPGQGRPVRDRRAHLRRHYRRAFGSLWPRRVGRGLLWLSVLLFGWLYVVPEALLKAPSPLLVTGAGLLLALLAAEVLLTVLRADLRDGFFRLTELLTNWTLAHRFEEAFEAPQKHYLHTPVYRAGRPPLVPAA